MLLIILLLLLSSLSIQSERPCLIRCVLRNGTLQITSNINEVNDIYLIIDTVDDQAQPHSCTPEIFHLQLPSYATFVDIAFRQFHDIQRPLTDFLVSRNTLSITVDSVDAERDVLLHRDLLPVLISSDGDKIERFHLEIRKILNPAKKLLIDALSLEKLLHGIELTFLCVLTDQIVTIRLIKEQNEKYPCSSMIDIRESTVATATSSSCDSNTDITDQLDYVYHYCKKTMIGMFGLFFTVIIIIICTFLYHQLPTKHELVDSDPSTPGSFQSPINVSMNSIEE